MLLLKIKINITSIDLSLKKKINLYLGLNNIKKILKKKFIIV